MIVIMNDDDDDNDYWGDHFVRWWGNARYTRPQNTQTLYGIIYLSQFKLEKAS